MPWDDESSIAGQVVSTEPQARLQASLAAESIRSEMPGRAAFRHPQAQHEIRLGQALVACEFKRARRRSIGMVVSVDGLSVRALKWASWSDIETALRSKERWICAKLVDQRERAQKLEVSRIEWKGRRVGALPGDHLALVLDPRASVRS